MARYTYINRCSTIEPIKNYVCIYVCKVLDYIVKDVDPYCGPATLSTPSLATTTPSLGVDKVDCQGKYNYGLYFNL